MDEQSNAVSPLDVVKFAREMGLTPEQQEELERNLAQFLLVDDYLVKTTDLRRPDISIVLWFKWFDAWSNGRAYGFSTIADAYMQLLVSLSRKGRAEIADLGHPFAMQEQKKKRGFFGMGR